MRVDHAEHDAVAELRVVHELAVGERLRHAVRLEVARRLAAHGLLPGALAIEQLLLRLRRPARRACLRRRRAGDDATPGRLRLLTGRARAEVVVRAARRALDAGGEPIFHGDDAVVEDEAALRAPAVDFTAGAERLRHEPLLTKRARFAARPNRSPVTRAYVDVRGALRAASRGRPSSPRASSCGPRRALRLPWAPRPARCRRLG